MTSTTETVLRTRETQGAQVTVSRIDSSSGSFWFRVTVSTRKKPELFSEAAHAYQWAGFSD